MKSDYNIDHGIFLDMKTNKLYCGHNVDVLKTFPDESVSCIVTSPPYYSARNYKTEPIVWNGDPSCQHEWGAHIIESVRGKCGCGNTGNHGKSIPGQGKKRDYGCYCTKCNALKSDLGLEPQYTEFIDHLVEIFSECKRVLRKDGVMFINIADTYAGSGGASRHIGYHDDKYLHGRDGSFVEPSAYEQENVKPKSLIQIPERLSIAMTDRLGFIKRNTIIWRKLNCMPSSANDRYTADFEYIYKLSKNSDYYFEQQFEPVSLSYAKDKRPNGVLRQRLYNYSKYAMEGMIETANIEGEIFDEERETYRNKRTTWDIITQPSNYEYCIKCDSYFEGAERKYIKKREEIIDGKKIFKKICPTCKSEDDWVNHFASFPLAIPQEAIKAGCPEFICNKCGKPRVKLYNDTGNMIQQGGYGSKLSNEMNVSQTSAIRTKSVKERKFTGYSDCGCNSGFSPGVVLDPFIGTGTTALAALSLNRRYVGIDLNPKYISIAQKRIDEYNKQLRIF